MAKRRAHAPRQPAADPQLTALRTLAAQYLAQAITQPAGNDSGVAQPSAYAGGGYTGARIDRAQLSRWQVSAGSPRSDLSGTDLATLRARSRDQMRNAPVALGGVNTAVSHIVGTGLSMTPAIPAERLGLDEDAAEDWQEDTRYRFGVWAGSVDCDLERQQNFYGKTELFQRSWLESGDAFAFTPLIERNGRRVLAIQLAEADRVCNPQGRANSEDLFEGIELSPTTREPMFVHVARRHPGDVPSGVNVWDKVAVRGASTGRRNVLHGFKPLRPGQVRGVPWVAPILEPLKQLQRWSDAELNAAVTSAIFSVFVKMDPNAFGDIYDEEAQEDIVARASWSGEMESGKAVNLLPGESIEAPAPGRPNPAFDPFWTSMVRQIGMALEIPFEVLVMHFQSSYSAARAALLMAWKMFRSRRDLLASTFCQPIYELWLEQEVAEGHISCPGFFADPMVRAAWCSAVWTGDGPGSIDPAKEVAAAKERVALEISTLDAESILHDGIDWKTKHRQRVREVNAQKADGTWLAPAGAAMPAPPPAEQGDDEEEKPGGQPDNATQDALAALSDRITALASEPRSITIHTPPIEVRAGDVHLGGVTVDGHEINVNLPEGCVQLEAHIEPAPTPQLIVQNSVQPAPVVIAQPSQSVAVHERDPATQELLRTVTTHSGAALTPAQSASK